MALFSAGTVQAQVAKWVDEKGIVHYGDVVPDKYRDHAKALVLRRDAPHPAQEKEVQLPTQHYREPKRAASLAPEPTPTAVIDSPAPLQTDGLSCQEQWVRYRQAQECFGPFRNANGSMKVEAIAQCPIVEEPTNCNDRRTSAR